MALWPRAPAACTHVHECIGGGHGHKHAHAPGGGHGLSHLGGWGSWPHAPAHMCACTSTYACMHQHICVHAPAHMHESTSTYTCMHQNICMHAPAHTHAHMHAPAHMHACTSTYACMHQLMRMHTSMHQHICMHAPGHIHACASTQACAITILPCTPVVCTHTLSLSHMQIFMSSVCNALQTKEGSPDTLYGYRCMDLMLSHFPLGPSVDPN